MTWNNLILQTIFVMTLWQTTWQKLPYYDKTRHDLKMTRNIISWHLKHTDHSELCKVAGVLQQQKLPLPGVEDAEGGHGAEQQDSVVLAHRLNLNIKCYIALYDRSSEPHSGTLWFKLHLMVEDTWGSGEAAEFLMQLLAVTWDAEHDRHQWFFTIFRVHWPPTYW